MDILSLGPQIPWQRLSLRNYAVHFRNMLIEERRSLIQDFKQYNLFEVGLQPLLPQQQQQQQKQQQDVYRIDVPGLREDNTPAIFVGDSLSVRAIRISLSMFGAVKYFDGTEYIAYISAIDRINVHTRLLLSLC